MNHILHHAPADFYNGEALIAAGLIREKDYAGLESLLKEAPKVVTFRGEKNLPLLAWAMGHNDSRAFKILLDGGAPPNDFIMVNDAKMSLLAVATGAESGDFFNLLLSHKANPNGVEGTSPPLFTARYAEKPERFDRLLDSAADVNRQDSAGKTILILLVLANDYLKALQLVDRGADVEARMKNGDSIRDIINEYPLPSDTEQGRAQEELKKLLR